MKRKSGGTHVADYMTTRQIAQLAGCDVKSVLRAIGAGRIKATKVEDSQVSTRARPPDRARRMVWHIVPASGREWVCTRRAR